MRKPPGADSWSLRNSGAHRTTLTTTAFVFGFATWLLGALPEPSSGADFPRARPLSPSPSAPRAPRPAVVTDYASLAIRLATDPAFRFAFTASVISSRGSELRVRLVPDFSDAFELVDCDWQRGALSDALRDWQALAGESVEGVTVLSSDGRVVGFVKLRFGHAVFHCS